MREDFVPRVVHFSTSHNGGAGIAARRLNSALNSWGFNSKFIALSNESFVPSSNEFALNRNQRQRMTGAALTFLHNRVFDKTYFTLGSISALSFLQIKELVPRNSIIHIHNWFNILDFVILQELLDYGYAVVFTLHDMRNLTGGCHYSLSCSKYLKDCGDCPYLPPGLRNIPSKNLESFKNLLDSYSNQVHFIAPSRWLEGIALSTELIPRKQIRFIPNIHPYGIYHDSNSQQPIIREKHGVLNVGIASLNVQSKLKGGDLLSELMLHSSKSQIEFSFLGEYMSLGCSQETFWNDIDYLLVSSRADNSPNVIHEAKLRNIPVIGTEVGGITELLNLEFDIGIAKGDLTSAHILKVLKNLQSELDTYRPRYFDAKYRQYVQHALESTINFYNEILS